MLKEATQFEHQQYILYQRADSEGKCACPPGSLTSNSHTHEKSQKLERSHICNTSFPICREMRSGDESAQLIGQLAQ